MKNKALKIACITAALSTSAQAIIVFEADFDAALTANTGSITYNAGFNTQISTGTGTNALFADPSSDAGTTDATDITLSTTADASLVGGATAVISFDFGIRRTNGANKSHYVTGYDANDVIIFQLVLGENDEFGNSGADRQKPGYATSTGGSTAILAADLASGPVPDQYYNAGDSNHADGYNGNGATYELTISSDGWVITGDGSFRDPFTTNSLATYDGSTFTELSYVKITGESAAAGGYFDNISINAIPEPSSTALLGLGGLSLILRRRK
ncbi:MAG: PEP-CTERM sorting domain-containing protein [Akkermansiaceae bacterium]